MGNPPDDARRPLGVKFPAFSGGGCIKTMWALLVHPVFFGDKSQTKIIFLGFFGRFFGGGKIVN